MRDKPTKFILELFDVNRVTLQGWVAKGCPCDHVKVKSRKTNLFDENEVASWLKVKGLSGKVGRPGGILTEQLNKARLRKETAMAELHELRVARERGLVVNKSDQERANVQKFNFIRSKLMGLASSIAPIIAGFDVPAIEAELDTRIRELLTELSRS